MARTARNTKLDTRSARAKLPQKKGGYWQTLTRGRSLGYRKGTKGGRWLVRLIDEQDRHEAVIGDADDIFDADGVSVFNYAQAQEKARAWFLTATRRQHGEHIGRGNYTVADAMRDYMEHYRIEGKQEKNTQSAINTHILPSLGSVEVAKLTSKRLSQWLNERAMAPALLRSSANSTSRNMRTVDDSGESKRQRRASANRTLTILKAALNYAWHQGRVGDDMAWRKVKPFKSVDNAVVRYLNQPECTRLINACPADFRALVHGAIYTGCRYDELARFIVADFNPDAGTITVCTSKANTSRHVTLTEEAQQLFLSLTAGKRSSDLIFTRDDGTAWKKSHQKRRLADACTAAKIEPAINFHILRHTHGSLLAMQGVPLPVIAKQLGHADTRMTEKHYAHLCPNYVSDTIRLHFPKLGLATTSQSKTVTTLRPKVAM